MNKEVSYRVCYISKATTIYNDFYELTKAREYAAELLRNLRCQVKIRPTLSKRICRDRGKFNWFVTFKVSPKQTETVCIKMYRLEVVETTFYRY